MSRFRRYVALAYALLAAALAVPVVAAATLVPPVAAVLGGVVVFFVFARVARRVMRDLPRPRWQVRCVDEPVFWLWGAGVISLGLVLPALGLGAGWAALRSEPAFELWPGVVRVVVGASLVISGWAVWGRRRLVKLRNIDVGIAELPPELDGYRIVQLSDLHIGSFDDKARGLEWVRRANAEHADLAVVTGDLVTAGTAYYDAASDVVAELRAKDGVLVIFGNHDQWDNAKFTRALQARGVTVLKNEWRVFERGAAKLCVAGLDDAYTSRSDLELTLAGRPAAAPTVLLSHYPEFFEPAASLGVDLVLAGHTHGGQFAVPFASRRLNLAALSRQRGRGLFRERGSQLYVNAGLGTTGPPLRLGVAPEIAVLRLRRAAAAPKG
jgi:hypothetical protein